jgi:hypothetical protein
MGKESTNTNTSIARWGLSYPDNDLDAWCNIRIFKYEYRAEATPGASLDITKAKGNIKLPLPLQLQTGYQQQWNSTDEITAQLAQLAAGGGNITDQIKNAAANPQTTGAAAALLGKLFGASDSAAGTAGGIVAAGVSAVGAVKGFTTNKYESVTYEKPVLRTHQFSWNLVAKSAAESKSIRDIIHKLKYASHPGGGGGALYSYPELFKLYFSPYDKTQGLFTIGASVLETFSVDYHAAGRPLYHATDEMPISVTIACTFKETAALTKELIKAEGR